MQPMIPSLRSTRLLPSSLLTLGAVIVPAVAHAHVGVGPANGLVSGLAHPLTGLDHVCAMLAVGLWAGQRGGRAVWLAPLTFLGVMTLGALLGMAGIAVPFVESGILASVLVLGVMTAAAVRLPLLAGTLTIGLFALLHGHSHGSEMPAAASALVYGSGFLSATAALLVGGVALSFSLQRLAHSHVIRYVGGAIAVCGVYLCVA